MIWGIRSKIVKYLGYLSLLDIQLTQLKLTVTVNYYGVIDICRTEVFILPPRIYQDKSSVIS